MAIISLLTNIESHGNIRVICDKPGFMRKLASEINFALSGQQFATYISNIEEMEEALASKGHIWVMEHYEVYSIRLNLGRLNHVLSAFEPGRVYRM